MVLDVLALTIVSDMTNREIKTKKSLRTSVAQFVGIPFHSIRIGMQRLDCRLDEEAHATQTLMAQVVCSKHKCLLLSVHSEKFPLNVAKSHAGRIGLAVFRLHTGDGLSNRECTRTRGGRLG